MTTTEPWTDDWTQCLNVMEALMRALAARGHNNDMVYKAAKPQDKGLADFITPIIDTFATDIGMEPWPTKNVCANCGRPYSDKEGCE